MKTENWKQQLTEQDMDAYTERLIRQVEEEGLIPAPAHMKQEILKCSQSLEYQVRVQTRQIPKKLQFFFYSMKVGAAVVTALFLLFMVPREIPDINRPLAEAAMQREETLGDRLNQGMHSLNRMILEFNWSVKNGYKMEE